MTYFYEPVYKDATHDWVDVSLDAVHVGHEGTAAEFRLREVMEDEIGIARSS